MRTRDYEVARSTLNVLEEFWEGKENRKGALEDIRRIRSQMDLEFERHKKLLRDSQIMPRTDQVVHACAISVWIGLILLVLIGG